MGIDEAGLSPVLTRGENQNFRVPELFLREGRERAAVRHGRLCSLSPEKGRVREGFTIRYTVGGHLRMMHLRGHLFTGRESEGIHETNEAGGQRGRRRHDGRIQNAGRLSEKVLPGEHLGRHGAETARSGNITEAFGNARRDLFGARGENGRFRDGGNAIRENENHPAGGSSFRNAAGEIAVRHAARSGMHSLAVKDGEAVRHGRAAEAGGQAGVGEKLSVRVPEPARAGKGQSLELISGSRGKREHGKLFGSVHGTFSRQGRLAENHVHVGAAEPEGTDTGQTGMSFGPQPGRGLHGNSGRNSRHVDGGVEFREMKCGRNGFRGKGNKRAAYAGETGTGFEMADAGLDRGNDQWAFCRVASRVHVVDGTELDGIAERRTRAVRLYGVNVRRRKAG